MDDSSEAEFLEEFGASLTDDQLVALLARVRDSGDADVRVLVKQYRTLRRATHLLLADLDTAVDLPAAQAGEAARFARFIVGAEECSTPENEAAT